MYAVAEMLIANSIKKIIIPFDQVTCDGVILGNPAGEPFERFTRNLDEKGMDKELEQKFMTVVAVYPGRPAIDTGGGVVSGGFDRSIESTLGNDEKINSPYTNSFTVSKGEDGFASENEDETGNPRREAGGKSANLNFEGSIEVSVGQDNHDNKSIVLDTAGSLIAWFGADDAGRSMVIQTDGEVLLNVGGTNQGSFNAGRFDLRVNVTDKGFVGDADHVPEGGSHASDYIISISDAGLVIAGMNPGVPMIIRNDGEISIESTAKLVLAGNSIEMREGNTLPKPSSGDDVARDSPGATIEGVADLITCMADMIADVVE
jgi:hypothetical protein